MGHRKCRNTEWEAPKLPKAPKKICTGTLRRLLGIVSPSKEMYYAAAGDKEVQEYRLGVIKYMNYKRLTTKEAWRAFYRYLRQKEREGSKAECTET